MARIGDTLLSQLVILHCNNGVWFDVLYADSMSVCCVFGRTGPPILGAAFLDAKKIPYKLRCPI